MKRIVLSAIVVSTLGVAGSLQAADTAPPAQAAPVTVQTPAQLAALPAAQVILLPSGGKTTAGELRALRDDAARVLGAKARAAEAAYTQSLAAAPVAAQASQVVLLGQEAFVGPSTPIPFGSGTFDCATWNVKASICWAELVSSWSIPPSSVKGVSAMWGPLSATTFTYTQNGLSYEASYSAYACTPTAARPHVPATCVGAMLHPGWVVDHVVSKVIAGSPGAASASMTGSTVNIKFGGSSPVMRNDAMMVWVYVKPAVPITKLPGTDVVK